MSGGIDWQAVKRRLAESEKATERSLSPDATRMRAVLRQRATRLAARRHGAAAAAQVLEVLSFRLGEEWCGLELTAVAEVQPFRRCTPVPGMPGELLGVVNLRGHIRPVLDLRRITGAKPGVEGQGYVLFLRRAEGEIGVRVDRIEAVRRLDPTTLVRPGEETGGLSSRFARGLTPEGLAVLDARAVAEALTNILTPAA